GAAASAPAPAPAQAPSQPAKLRVVIKPVKPFVMPDLATPSGYSIDLWRRVAQEAGLDFEFVPVRTNREMLEALENGSADVAVGALSITADREARLDFSYSYFESGLQIVVNERSRGPGLGAFAGLFKVEVLMVIGVLLLALLVNSH